MTHSGQGQSCSSHCWITTSSKETSAGKKKKKKHICRLIWCLIYSHDSLYRTSYRQKKKNCVANEVW